ncbi:MAG: CotH kinase family protein, partial [Bacillota bacterium]
MDRLQRRRIIANWTRVACNCTASVLRNLRKQLGASSAQGRGVLPLSELLEPRQLLAVTPLISEFMANNGHTLTDKDGDYSDWIEIQNPTSNPLNLDGYFLTDDPNQLNKWRIPATTLAPGGYTLVFASGKDLAVAGQQLHTNFSLNDAGEYLALVAPDGSTIVSEYAPAYPPQLEDVSYGYIPGGTINTTILTTRSSARFLIPSNSNLGSTWTGRQFDDSKWTNGSLGLGFETNTGNPLPNEIEGNNSVAEANDALGNFSLFSGSLYQLSLAGTILSAADSDFYKIGSLQSGDVLTISASGVGSSRGTLGNTYVELYRLNAGHPTLVASDDDGGPGGNTDSLIHRFTIAANDTYLVKVKSMGDATGTYNLSLYLENSGSAPTTDGSLTTEVEPNDSSTTATDVSSSWSAVQYLSRTTATAGSSEDFYRFQFTAGDIITITLDAIGTMDASVYLLNSAGTVIASDDGTTTAPDPYSNDASIYSFRIPTTGTYYVKMHKNSGSSNPAYSANVYLSTTSSPPKPAVFAGLINTNLQSRMLNINATAYVRIPFYVGDPSIIDTLLLRMKYDDGFVAYLNGQQIVSRNAPSTLAYNSTAVATRPTDQQAAAEDIDLSEFKNLLVPGDNILAIQGLNISKDNSDFLVLPELQSVSTIDAGMQYFTTPTPGKANVPGSLGYVTDTKFDHDRGFYDAPFMLSISTDTPGAEIRYTINGTPPTASTGTVYTGPIRIDKTTTLRVAAFKPGYIASTADTQTYIFLDDVIRQSSTGQRPSSDWPSGSVNGQTINYGMDPDIVNNIAYKNTIKDDLKSIPTLSIVTDLKNLFDPNTGIYVNAYGDGQAWERPASIELINPDGTKGFQSDIGLRIRGGYSRSGGNPKHGFRIFFRSEYGQGKLDYPLFGDDAAQSVDCFDLRATANYSWAFEGDPRGILIRDSFSRETQLDMGQPATRGQFYHLYIDGQYWGVYNSEERPEASYAADYFGGEKEDYDVIKVNANAYNVYATDGNMDAWNRLWAACFAGMSSNAAYYKIQGRNPDGTLNPNYENLLDVDNLIDYMLTIYYTGNFDAPYSAFVNGPNNFYAIYNRKAKDGFKFFAHDSEHTLMVGNTSFGDGLTINRTGPYATYADPTRATPQGIFQQLMANNEFKLRVADHIQKHFFNGGALTPQATAARFTELKNEIDRAVVGESARWGDSKTHPALTRTTWLNQINTLLTQYFPRRSDIVLSQLKAKKLYPTTAAPSFNQFGGIISSGFNLTITSAAGATTYYTLDGSDPRLIGGAVSSQALTYASGIPLNQTVTVKARTLSGTTWSALTEATFTFDMSALRITELMYNPAPPPAGSPFVKDDFE